MSLWHHVVCLGLIGQRSVRRFLVSFPVSETLLPRNSAEVQKCCTIFTRPPFPLAVLKGGLGTRLEDSKPWTRAFLVLQQLDIGAVPNPGSCKSTYRSSRMCCLHCCICDHHTRYQKKGMVEIVQESLQCHYLLQHAVLCCGHSSSELLTPTLSGVSMV